MTYLEVNIHFKVDEKNKNVILTKEGAVQILKNPFKTQSQMNIKPLVNEINSLESKFELLADHEIRLKTSQLRKQYQITGLQNLLDWAHFNKEANQTER